MKNKLLEIINKIFQRLQEQSQLLAGYICWTYISWASGNSYKIMRASLVLFLSDSINVYKLSPLTIIFYNNLKKVALLQSYLGNLNNLLNYSLHLFEMGNTGKN